MVGGAHGYIISQKCAQFFVDQVSKIGIKNGIDYWMMLHFPSLKVYLTRPHLLYAKYADFKNPTAEKIDSDIQYSDFGTF